MAGFQRRSFGAAKSGAANNAQLWNLRVNYAKYNEKGNFLVRIGGMKKEDVDKLSTIDPSFFKIQQDPKTYETYIVFNGKRLNEIDNYQQKIESALMNTKNYTDSSVKNLFDSIRKQISSTPNKEDEDNFSKQIAQNWRELLVQLKDPNVRKKFLNFQTRYVCAKHFKDAMLSQNNIADVLAADPLASFVATEECWNKTFKRRVIPNSKYVIIWKPFYTKASKSDLDNDEMVKDLGGWNNVVNMSQGDKRGIAFAAKKRVSQNKGRNEYYRAKAYDVRFTVPIDPNDDPFLQVAGLISNITGEVNDPAKTMIKQNQNISDKDINAKTVGLADDKEIIGFKDFIMNKCKRESIILPQIGDAKDIAINGVYAYAFKKAESLNMLHDKLKTLFASTVTLGVASAFGISTSKVDNCIELINKVPANDLETMATCTFETFKTLTSFRPSMAESIEDPSSMTFEEYHDLILSFAKKTENIKNDFMEMLDRINKPIKE